VGAWRGRRASASADVRPRGVEAAIRARIERFRHTDHGRGTP